MKRKIPIERLQEVERRLLKAQSPTDFTGELSKLWGISKRQVWKYVARVRAQFAERAKLNHSPEADREIAKSMLLNAYRVAEVGSVKFGPDCKTMVQAAKVYAEVTGALAPQQINHNVNAAVVVLPELETSAMATEPGTTDKVFGK